MGHAIVFHTMPPAHTLVRRVDWSAFASIVQARPCPVFGRPVHPFDYGLVLLLKPFRPHLAMDALPSGYLPASKTLPLDLDMSPPIRNSVGL